MGNARIARFKAWKILHSKASDIADSGFVKSNQDALEVLAGKIEDHLLRRYRWVFAVLDLIDSRPLSINQENPRTQHELAILLVAKARKYSRIDIQINENGCEMNPPYMLSGIALKVHTMLQALVATNSDKETVALASEFSALIDPTNSSDLNLLGVLQANSNCQAALECFHRALQFTSELRDQPLFYGKYIRTPSQTVFMSCSYLEICW
jgi:hypothetical protein